jgi:hypothetical protein
MEAVLAGKLNGTGESLRRPFNVTVPGLMLTTPAAVTGEPFRATGGIR